MAGSTADRPRPFHVFVVGVDGGPDPCSGVGLASSLRLAFPTCVLVAVGSSRQSSGLNWPAFDGWLVTRNRRQLTGLASKLGAHTYLIPTVDDDIFRLGRMHSGSGPLLAPGGDCLRRLLKPAGVIADLLSIGVPPSMNLPCTRRRFQQFVQQWGRNLWLKGLISGAERLPADMRATFRGGTTRSQGGPALLQAHIEGRLEAAAFAAYRGRLLNAVWLKKQGTTAGGKTWSGIVSGVSTGWRSRLERLVASLGWHGGGECEFVRDRTGLLWLIDVNPRFPAWIHGATLCGHNLPAELIAAASGRAPISFEAKSHALSRVVVEVAVEPPLATTLRHHRVDL